MIEHLLAPELEYLAIKADATVADKLNEAFKDGWHVWQTFNFGTESNGSGLSTMTVWYPVSNAVVILEREKRG